MTTPTAIPVMAQIVGVVFGMRVGSSLASVDAKKTFISLAFLESIGYS
jgi:hypothetical protein